MENSSALNGPTQEAYDAACAALWAHRDRANALEAALDAIRVWRHGVPTIHPAEFAGLDAVLDAAVDGVATPLQRLRPPSSLQEAVAAHRAVMRERNTSLAATRVVWDQIEAAALRDIDRHMHPEVG
ncbi:hypothetical protein [Streptomyces sp. NBC_00038]|uniref:hypothetical protein n=1 Tax=Streptomyces sp. NBC_00038 TaxID=2903615 RepID=UPI00224D3A17|nr:hypothetical protein [Streptomyces sp. NBC_00038]MCX5562747.1 hypothetical protein [Streptomyces sp. NBC_00038]MCX5563603.1 hypothetical protein [Streptomyces sp. NBC_00038]